MSGGPDGMGDLTGGPQRPASRMGAEINGEPRLAKARLGVSGRGVRLPPPPLCLCLPDSPNYLAVWTFLPNDWAGPRTSGVDLKLSCVPFARLHDFVRERRALVSCTARCL